MTVAATITYLLSHFKFRLADKVPSHVLLGLGADKLALTVGMAKVQHLVMNSSTERDGVSCVAFI